MTRRGPTAGRPRAVGADPATAPAGDGGLVRRTVVANGVRPAYLEGGRAAYGATTLAPERWVRAAVLSVPPTRVFRSFLRRDGAQQRVSWYQFLFQVPLAEDVVSEDDFAFVDRHRIEAVPEVGHFLHLAAPAPVNPKIVSFLRAASEGR